MSGKRVRMGEGLVVRKRFRHDRFGQRGGGVGDKFLFRRRVVV